MSLDEEFDSNYRYVLVAARRARQLLSGARPAIETVTRKPCKIAQEEIKAGKVHWTKTELPKSPLQVASELLDNTVTPESTEDE
jgi:DNA-directed RNA polymerase subunit omega